jgi:hypothetical protein
MKRISRNAWPGRYGALGLVFLLLASWAYAEERFENMDLKALSAQAAQWKERLDQNPSDYEALRNLGIVYHDMAIRDSKACGRKAAQYLEQAYQKKPDDHVVLCYLGSAYTLLAKDASNPVSKAYDLNKGVEYMDKAVRKDPDNITVRLIRANNSKALSSRFLSQRSTAYEDFEHVAGLFEKGLKVPSQLKASVYRSLAELYKEGGKVAEAKKYQIMAESVQKEK